MEGFEAFANVYLGKIDYWKIFQRSDKMFTDPIFKDDVRSLTFTGQDRRGVVWKRPQELLRDPHFYVDLNSRFDVKQVTLLPIHLNIR